MVNHFLKTLRKKIQPFFDKGGSHGFDHTERVFRLATIIAEKEGADLEIVQTAALLHDIARKKEAGGEVECHAAQGAKDAEKILQETGFDKSKIPLVVDCIAVHRFRKGIVPKTIEGKVLQDADRLDVLGAIGVARVFSFGGYRMILYKFMPVIKPIVKILKITDQFLFSISHIIVDLFVIFDTSFDFSNIIHVYITTFKYILDIPVYTYFLTLSFIELFASSCL